MQNKDKKTVTVVLLEVFIAAIFILGVDKFPSLKIQFHSYFADLAIPFAFYFLLVPNESRVKLLRKSGVKALIVFSLCATSEILQYFGIFALARVFDPMDFLMYAVGAGLAIFVDRQIFSRFLSYWNHK